VKYTLFSADGTPVRASVANLRSIIGANTDYNYEGHDSQASVVANGFDETSVALHGYSIANVSVANDGASISFSGRALVEPDATRFEATMARKSCSLVCYNYSGIDFTLTGYEDANLDVDFFDGRVLSAADLKVEAIDVENFTVAIQSPVANHTFQGNAAQRGSTQANRRYLYFAKVADVESDPDARHALSLQSAGYERAAVGLELTGDKVDAALDLAIPGGASGDPAASLSLIAQTLSRAASSDAPGSIAVSLGEDSAQATLENLAIAQAQLIASGLSGFTRTLSDVEIHGGYSESIDMALDIGRPVGESKPLLIIAEDIEVAPGAQFRSDVEGAGHVVRRTQNLTLGDGSSYFESIAATADADSAASDKRKQSLYFPEDMLKEIQVGAGASFESRVFGSPNDDFLVQRRENLQVHGAYVGTFHMGAGADFLSLAARDVVVHTAASFDLDVAGAEGRDVIGADIEATVDGHYRFLAAGGSGEDIIGTVQTLAATRPQRTATEAAAPSAIEILLTGEDGNDLLAAWLFTADIDEDSIQALIDGGLGIDACSGNVDAINCELAAIPMG
jgi:hypothetical protein